MCFITEAFIRNFSAPYSLLQRHLVGEADRTEAEEEAMRSDEHQHSPPRLLITELTTSSFLPSVMDLQKVIKLSASGAFLPSTPSAHYTVSVCQILLRFQEFLWRFHCTTSMCWWIKEVYEIKFWGISVLPNFIFGINSLKNSGFPSCKTELMEA